MTENERLRILYRDELYREKIKKKPNERYLKRQTEEKLIHEAEQYLEKLHARREFVVLLSRNYKDKKPFFCPVCKACYGFSEKMEDCKNNHKVDYKIYEYHFADNDIVPFDIVLRFEDDAIVTFRLAKYKYIEKDYEVIFPNKINFDLKDFVYLMFCPYPAEFFVDISGKTYSYLYHKVKKSYLFKG